MFGGRRVSFKRIMSIFNLRTRAWSSKSLCLIPLQFQNSILRQVILSGGEEGEEGLNSRFKDKFWILVGSYGGEKTGQKVKNLCNTNGGFVFGCRGV